MNSSIIILRGRQHMSNSIKTVEKLEKNKNILYVKFCRRIKFDGIENRWADDNMILIIPVTSPIMAKYLIDRLVEITRIFLNANLL